MIRLGKIDGRDMKQVRGTGEVYTGFWLGDLREGDHLGDQGVDGIIVLKCVFKNCVGEAWTGLIGLRIGAGNGRL